MPKTQSIKIEITGDLAEKIAQQISRVEAAYEDADKEFIRVYRFSDAPADLRALSNNGGDEDWLAIVPADYEERHYISWLQEGSPFGVCTIERHELLDGSAVYIGCHA